MKNFNDTSLQDYLLNEDQVFSVMSGKLCIIRPQVAPFKPMQEIANASLPNMEYNRYYFRQRTNVAEKILHKTYNVEIIDYEALFPNECKQGKIVQYIQDDAIITALEYTTLESEAVFIKRVLHELNSTIKYFSDDHQKTRFFLEGMIEQSDKEKFTQIVLTNLNTVVKVLNNRLMELTK